MTDANNLSQQIEELNGKIHKPKVNHFQLRYSTKLVVAPGWQVNEYVQYPVDLPCI